MPDHAPPPSHLPPPPPPCPSAPPIGSVAPRRVGGALWLLGALLGLGVLGLWLAYSALHWLHAALPESLDEKLAQPFWAQLEASPERCSSGTAQRYVDELVQPLERALPGSAFRYRFMVVKDPAVNAFALPGGYVVVNLGLLEAAESSEEIAAVLAHEMSHVELRHGSRRLVRVLGGSLVLSLIFGGADPGVLAGAVSELAQKGYDRSEEADADAQGIALLARAGISARGMASFFRRLAQSPSLPELLSTHPDPGARAERAEQLAAEGPRTTAALPRLPERWTCD